MKQNDVAVLKAISKAVKRAAELDQQGFKVEKKAAKPAPQPVEHQG